MVTNQAKSDLLLGLFPSMDHLGGIQVSGRIAWEALTRSDGQNSRRTRLVCYEPSNGQVSTAIPGATRAYSKTGALISAVKNGGNAQDILIWHLGLLKILPFIPTNNSRVSLFLHGVEAWCRHGRLTSRLLNRVDLFLANSNFTWQRFIRNNPAFANANHRIVPLGIGAAAGYSSGPPAGPVALMVGRMCRDEDYKGHREVLNAWRSICRKIPGAQLWIVGDGDLKTELELEVSNHSLNDSVKFFGVVSEEQKEKLYSQCRCLVLPSRGEGFGFVYVEAMRAGRPCLVSTLDAGREVVNPPEAGLSADPTDPEDLADVLGRLLADGPEWQSWSTAARRRYDSLYTARHFQERLLSALALESQFAEAAG